MIRRFIVVLTIALFLPLLWAQEKPTVQSKTISRTSPSDGKAMFVTHCAACHGMGGKGDGPAALALKKAPADLTGINARNGGKFPDTKVAHFIEGADEIVAHGGREMPVWGDLFKSLDGKDPGMKAMRLRNLTEYIRSIQRK